MLIPTLRPGDIVVMDNLRTHHVQAVGELLRDAGAKSLVNRSCRFNQSFHKVKATLRKLRVRSPDALDTAIQFAFRPQMVEPDEGWMGDLAAGWFSVMADLERDADWQFPTPPTWKESKQRRREAQKKLAMGQKFGGSEVHNFELAL